jgi:hypothetical protein
VTTITFPDRETEKRALAILLGRFSGHILKTGEHRVPDEALSVLSEQQIAFSVVDPDYTGQARPNPLFK